LPVRLNYEHEPAFKDGQFGRVMDIYEKTFPDLNLADIVILGCGEQRGAGFMNETGAADAIRKEFYSLFHWHQDIRLADIGNVKMGRSAADTSAALKMVVQELVDHGKLVVVLGGSHDLTVAQYQATSDGDKLVDVVGIDALIDIDIDSPFRSHNFLMDILTSEPNFVRHYNHLAFQSYYAHPKMMETMDKLRFDCFRLGWVKEHIEEMEPVIRNCHVLSFDISAIANAFAPANQFSPNGLNGEEACVLMQFAGLSDHMRTIGIYGYQPENENGSLTAKQIAQMLWYLVDGKARGSRESSLDQRESFNEYHTSFTEVETIFLQSKKTGRWWMQLPDKKFIACSHKDYITASSNEYPERWLRHQERP
jgi:formiminoglutamase